MLPNPLSVPLRLLPDTVHAEILTRTFNHLLRGQPIGARLPELYGKTVCIDIKDTGSRIHFRIDGNCLRPAIPGATDVRISGTVADFWLLATRREDPDTLFFSRRLCIEGDTETGVHVKNLLDALEYDWESHFRDVLGNQIGGVATTVFQRTLGKRLSARSGVR